MQIEPASESYESDMHIEENRNLLETWGQTRMRAIREWIITAAHGCPQLQRIHKYVAGLTTHLLIKNFFCNYRTTPLPLYNSVTAESPCAYTF
ncbi:hypothetical protein EVAR_90349_1 [Eumeta japonica]|uniref:Uncharacterized protein n=1 Tax=Eumeta variegata TaxID=151549 RepID=A0A4C1YJF2_EUMVA|nr:hypothetical protein EVAR_90349_1 [Eumeta japonica]